jgi:DNA-binding response OmpR family regulator
VLVVEDDRTARRAIASILRMQGYAVSEAATLADATRQTACDHHNGNGDERDADLESDDAAPQPPEWILLDLMLPDGTGVDLLRRIRRDGLATRVCVITGCGAAMLGEVQTLDPDYIFTKPLDVDRLLAALRA